MVARELLQVSGFAEDAWKIYLPGREGKEVEGAWERKLGREKWHSSHG